MGLILGLKKFFQRFSVKHDDDDDGGDVVCASQVQLRWRRSCCERQFATQAIQCCPTTPSCESSSARTSSTQDQTPVDFTRPFSPARKWSLCSPSRLPSSSLPFLSSWSSYSGWEGWGGVATDSAVGGAISTGTWTRRRSASRPRPLCLRTETARLRTGHWPTDVGFPPETEMWWAGLETRGCWGAIAVSQRQRGLPWAESTRPPPS